MNKPKHIQLSIPHPCTQNWDEMTPDAKGRHCAHCQKTVIDFTAWSDAALYNYFTKNTGAVCGRFTAMQLDRPMSIPYQPHSKLYRIAIALGLTLTLSQTPHLHAQNRPPWLPAHCAIPQRKQTNDTRPGQLPGELRGRIFDDKKEPLPSAVVQVFRDSIAVGGKITDYDGNYSIKPLEPGNYEVLVRYIGFDSFTRKSIVVVSDSITKFDFVMKKPSNLKVLGGMITTEYRVPLKNMNNPTKRTFTREDMDRMPH